MDEKKENTFSLQSAYIRIELLNEEKKFIVTNNIVWA